MTRPAERPAWARFEIEELRARRRQGGRAYHEFLRVADLSAGVYELEAGAADPQKPHGEDELYFVVQGRARFTAAGEETEVGPGSVLYVRTGVEHRFEAISEDLTVLVFFAPAETEP